VSWSNPSLSCSRIPSCRQHTSWEGCRFLDRLYFPPTVDPIHSSMTLGGAPSRLCLGVATSWTDTHLEPSSPNRSDHQRRNPEMGSPPPERLKRLAEGGNGFRPPSRRFWRTGRRSGRPALAAGWISGIGRGRLAGPFRKLMPRSYATAFLCRS
jgi:hypothetical protein